MSPLPDLHPVRTRGVDHLALVTEDLPATMDFYTRVLGMRLSTCGGSPTSRTAGSPRTTISGTISSTWAAIPLLAFFEYPKGLPRQNRDHPGGMQHLAFHVPQDRFDEMIEHVKSCGVHVVGLIPLGGRFWSAYFLDPNGIRLEIATSLAPTGQTVVQSVLQTAGEARAELETLFSDPEVVEAWLARMPLKAEAPATV